MKIFCKNFEEKFVFSKFETKFAIETETKTETKVQTIFKKQTIMTQNEFETLAGRKVKTTEDFNEIHVIYMSTNLDKADFVRAYESPNHYDLVRFMAEELEAEKKKVTNYALQHEDEGRIYARIAYADESRTARERAIEILGEREYIKYVLTSVLEEGFDLSDEDRDLILAIL